MRNVRELVQLSTDYLEKRGVSHARREAEELLAFLLKRKRLELYFDYDAPLEEKEIERYRAWIKRKGDKEPLAYILGEVDFMDLTIRVTPEVLIPRQETEILADLILKKLPEKPCAIWDVCTGSGCLGLAIKNARPDCNVTLSDVSEGALSIARENAQRSELEVALLQGDLLESFEGKADIIVCNPPYITEEEYRELEDEVRLFEPKLALVGGLSFYERLARDLPAVLNPGAKVFFEIGMGQRERLEALFDQSPWKSVRCEKDWAGHDRFFFLEVEGNLE